MAGCKMVDEIDVDIQGASFSHLGGYDYDFVDPPSSDYECPVCLLTLRDPQIVDCCGLKFCLLCIELVFNSKKSCPLCKQPFRFMSEKQLKRRIEDLKVHCPQREAGCAWIGELRDLEKLHQTMCLFVEVACSLGCGAMLQRCEQLGHELDHCSKRSMEAKLHRLTQRLEERLVLLEEKCSQQEKDVIHLKEVMNKKEVEMQNAVCRHKEEVATLKKALGDEVTSLHSKQHSMFTMIENELMKRCFSFNISLGYITGEQWASPPFFSHRDGYQLQLTAELNHPKHSSSLEMIHKTLFQREDRCPVVLCLEVLPRERDVESLDWPVYITADILVLTNSDKSAHGNLHTLVKYKELLDGRASLETLCRNKAVIGHAERNFDCRIVVIRIEHSEVVSVNLTAGSWSSESSIVK